MPGSRSIRLKFLGGASEIGASSTLVQVGDTNILIDCGIRFRAGNPLPDLDQLTGVHLDAILLTHAHTDHSGGLPVVHDAFPDTPIYLTAPTVDLVTILQRDALRLMRSASDREGEIPLYAERQVEATLTALNPVRFAEPRTIGDVEVRFLPASHILGAAMIHLSTPEGQVLFTGDYSISAQRTVPALDRPNLPVDILVSESTYGDRLHSDRTAAERRLASRVSEILGNEGRVLIPAFAIGRAQEVLLILKRAIREKRLPKVPIFVDGMVRAVCGVYSSHPRYVTRSLQYDIRRTGHPFYTKEIRPIGKPEERRQVLEAGPCVIVSSSGMLSGGPSASYAEALAGNPRDAIFITGYQDEESPGRALLALADQEKGRRLVLGQKEVEVRCTFEKYGLSAHADRMQMVGLIEAIRPRTVVLVHGDTGARETFARHLERFSVELAAEGLQLSRRFGARRGARALPALETTITPEAARALVGDGQDQAIPLDQLAEAWYGRRANQQEREALARALEEAGAAKRDDNRRGLMWPQTEPAPSDEPDSEELELEADIKQANPKGKLLELCMRRRVGDPKRLSTIHGGRPVVELQVKIDGALYSSGVHSGYSEKLAEQLAAKALLEQLSEGLEAEEDIEVTDPERLKQKNPKGRLLEACTRHRLRKPRFEVTAVPGGYSGRVVLDSLAGVLFESRGYRAEKAKTVEQAAAEEALQAMERTASAESSSAGPNGPVQVRSDDSTAGSGDEEWNLRIREQQSKDSRMLLNQLRQVGWITDFGYRDIEHRGPSHQPIFRVCAWADLSEEKGRVEGEAAEGKTRKDAQRRAADALLTTVAFSRSNK